MIMRVFIAGCNTNLGRRCQVWLAERQIEISSWRNESYKNVEEANTIPVVDMVWWCFPDELACWRSREVVKKYCRSEHIPFINLSRGEMFGIEFIKGE